MAQGKGREGTNPSGIEADKVETAAAEIGQCAVGKRRTVEHAHGRKPGFLRAGKHVDLDAAGLLDPLNEGYAVRRVANRSCRDQFKVLYPHRERERGEPAQCAQGSFDTGWA